MRTLLALSFASLTIGAAYAADEKPVCEFVKEHMAKGLGLHAECKSDYSIYCKDTATNRKKGCGAYKRASKNTNVKIAGFNVYNLGMGQDFSGNLLTGLKQNHILAETIAQFDLTGAVELKHLAKEDRSFNEKLLNTINDLKSGKRKLMKFVSRTNEKSEITVEEIEGKFRVPQYLNVLKELIKIDSNFALVLSNDLYPRLSDDLLNNEIAGFFYKKNKFNLRNTKYCGPGVKACTVKTKEFSAEIARKPFLATFKAGKMEFTMAAVHFRFRRPTKKVNKKPVLDEALYNPMMEVFDFSKETGYEFKNNKTQQNIKHETSSRFAEAKMVIDFLGTQRKAGKIKDPILYGDFNLAAPRAHTPAPERKNDESLQEAFKVAWDKILPGMKGAEVYVNSPSTVGKKTLGSNFDHLVLAKAGKLYKCDVEKAEVFDFTNEDVFPSGHALIRKIDKEAMLDEFSKALNFKSTTTMKHRYTSGKMKFWEIGVDNKLIGSYNEGTKVVFSEAISDHLPVYMNCNTK